MSVLIDGKKLFTKEMTKVFQEEVIECPECMFEFSTKHHLEDAKGCYECPVCKETELEIENERLKKVLKNIADMKKVGLNHEYVIQRYSEYAQHALDGKFEE